MGDLGGRSYPYEGEVTQDDKMWGLIAHLSPLLPILLSGGLLAPVGPLIVWAVKKDTSPFVRKHALEALAFSIAMLIVSLLLVVIGIATICIGIGFLILLLGLPLLVVYIIYAIVAAMKANEGLIYEYPLTSSYVK